MNGAFGMMYFQNEELFLELQNQQNNFEARWASVWYDNWKISTCDGSKLPVFSYGRDGHQPYSRGLECPSEGFPTKGGMSLSPI